MIAPGQVVLFISPKGKRYFRQYEPDGVLNTHDGRIDFSCCGPLEFGAELHTHLGKIYRVVKPTLYDCVKFIKRSTQILYPKDIGYVLLKLGVAPGSIVVEAGTGSGGLTTALAWCVGDAGHVHSCDRRPEFTELCRRNLEKLNLAHRVTLYSADLADGFPCPKGECLFLDVRTPWDYLQQAADAVIPGAPMGFLVPTANQAVTLLEGLTSGPFDDVEMVEILVRHYKPVPERLRPDDRMVAHTGFLLFARKK